MEIELEVTDSAINKISSVMESEDMPLDKALFRLKVIGQNSTEFEYSALIWINSKILIYNMNLFFNFVYSIYWNIFF